jgi:hypothetical protein
MTVTSLAWLAVAMRTALVGVRFVHPRKQPARVPAGSDPDEHSWRPRVSSGCGR